MNYLNRLRRFPWDMIGWRNWVQKLLDKQKTTNQPNRTLIQFIERGDPLWPNKPLVRSAQEIDTRFSLDCKHTNLFVERIEKDKDTDKDVDADRDRTGRPVVNDSQPVRPRNLKSWTSIVGCLDCHMPLWNKPIFLVFVNSWRRSRVTLIDKIFKPIYNKVMPTTHLVKNQKDDSGHLQCRAIWVVRDNS